jgi:serine phosphatase RsbU (regulator of sigma subunit)
MRSRSPVRPPRGRAFRRLALVVLAAAAISLAFIPSATAKRHEQATRTATTTTTTATTTAASETSAASTPSGSSEPSGSSTSTPAVTHKHGGSGSEMTHQGSTTGTAGAGKGASGSGKAEAQGHSGATAGSQGAGGSGSQGRAGTGRRGGTRAGRAGKPAGGQGAPEAAGESSAAGGEGQASAQAQVRAAGHGQGGARKSSKGHHKEGTSEGSRAHESGKHGKTKAEEKAEQEKAEKEAEQHAGQGGGSTPPVISSAPPVEALTPVASAASSTPAATATSPVSTALLPSVGLAAPTRTAQRAHPARGATRHRRGGRAGAPAATAAAAAPGAGVVPAGTPGPGAGGRATRSARPALAHHASSGSASRIVTTITRIVDVVPAAMRWLIGALLALALALAVRSLLSALRARRLERQRRELLDDVGLLQAALLPEPPARLGPVGTSVAYSPAEGPGAGGDFYDVFALEDGLLAVIVGDVSGHGRQALPHTALVRFTLRAYLEAGLSPRDALQTAGAVLERQLGGVFATVVVATYQPRERLLTYASAGHPPPLVLGTQPGAGTLSPVTICSAPPIGTGMRTGTRQTTIALPGRARVCFYTDGVTEARVGRELFGSERLGQMLAELAPEAGATELLGRVAAYADARPDDMAACLLTVEGGQDAPHVLVEELEIDREEATSMRTESFLRACGVERGGIAEVTGSAAGAAGRAGTVVVEVRDGGGTPEVSLRRDHVSYLHARRVEVGVAR